MRYLSIAISLAALILAGLAYFTRTEETPLKQGFIRSHDLVYRYKGAIEAREKFEKKKSTLQANVDSLAREIDQLVLVYEKEYPILTTDARTRREEMLTARRDQYMEYRRSIEEKIKEEEGFMMDGVLNQINAYVKEYAEANGFTLVFGTTLDGNLLYAKENMDITEAVLETINKKYEGER